ncbi:MAG: exodeoxyribonuclease III [Methylococcaceae bacterium]
MKIISWNVNGIRAAQKKGLTEKLQQLDADIICLQETKAQPDQVEKALQDIDGYHLFAHSAVKKGYSGVAVLTKQSPLEVTYGIAIHEHDQEGRVITTEYDAFFLVGVYVPNAGQELVRLDYRKTWDKDFQTYIKNLETQKPVIACGDFNVAHQPIDIARPKPNYNKSAGYTQVEIDGFCCFLNGGLVDTFRAQHPETVAYSWWSYRANARANNIGWRIDYVLSSQALTQQVKDAFILPDIIGSDHCPVGIDLDI